ncbi:hypothetical protein G7046_g2496 [Stylonectria norvegica]|nr:hypothetical protein G7046_g2496 [Stylonectria norvegica]
MPPATPSRPSPPLVFAPYPAPKALRDLISQAPASRAATPIPQPLDLAPRSNNSRVPSHHRAGVFVQDVLHNLVDEPKPDRQFLDSTLQGYPANLRPAITARFVASEAPKVVALAAAGSDDAWLPREFRPSIDFRKSRLYTQSLATITRLANRHGVPLRSLWEEDGVLRRATMASGVEPPVLTHEAVQQARNLFKEELDGRDSEMMVAGDQDAASDSDRFAEDAGGDFDASNGDDNDGGEFVVSPEHATDDSPAFYVQLDKKQASITPRGKGKARLKPHLVEHGRGFKAPADPDVSPLFTTAFKSHSPSPDPGFQTMSIPASSPIQVSPPRPFIAPKPELCAVTPAILATKVLEQLTSSSAMLTDDVIQLFCHISAVTSSSVVLDPLWLEVDSGVLPKPISLKVGQTMYIPLHHSSTQHWSLLVVRVQEDHLLVSRYDSVKSRHSSRGDCVEQVFEAWLQTYPSPKRTAFWTQLEGPAQDDATSCGVFVLAMLTRLVHREPIPVAFSTTAERQRLLRLLRQTSRDCPKLGEFYLTVLASFTEPRTSCSPPKPFSQLKPSSQPKPVPEVGQESWTKDDQHVRQRPGRSPSPSPPRMAVKRKKMSATSLQDASSRCLDLLDTTRTIRRIVSIEAELATQRQHATALQDNMAQAQVAQSNDMNGLRRLLVDGRTAHVEYLQQIKSVLLLENSGASAIDRGHPAGLTQLLRDAVQHVQDTTQAALDKCAAQDHKPTVYTKEDAPSSSDSLQSRRDELERVRIKIAKLENEWHWLHTFQKASSVKSIIRQLDEDAWKRLRED